MVSRLIIRAMTVTAFIMSLPASAHIATHEHMHGTDEVVAGVIIAAIGVFVVGLLIKRVLKHRAEQTAGNKAGK